MRNPPKKPSALIRLAMKDLTKVENAPKKYNVDMGEWHTPAAIDDRVKKCTVCFAGSVMAKTLEANPEKHRSPDDYKRWGKSLYALNDFRVGNIMDGLVRLGLWRDGLWRDGLPKNIPVERYYNNKKQFHKDMALVAGVLEKFDL